MLCNFKHKEVKITQLSQLEVILEAIDYIKTLQGKLDRHSSLSR